MFRRVLAFIAFGCLSLTATAQDYANRPIRFPRHPALSPDAKSIAFSYQGDIWTVPASGGSAQRLTVHEAHEQLPSWSPNGKWIAFASKREGNYDVWVISAGGGRPKQLTYHSADDLVCGWSPDNREITFSSARETTRYASIYAVNTDSGASRLIAKDETTLGSASYTPDGKRLAARRGGSPTRRGYRGSANSDIILADSSGSKPAEWLTKDEENENWALFSPDGRTFFYVCDRNGIANIWKRSVNGGRSVQITKHADGNLFYPSLSANGEKIVYERNFALWSVDTKAGEPQELRVYAPTDDRTNALRRTAFTSQVQEIAVSPDGKQVGFVVHGEIFVQPVSGGDESIRLTNTPQREEDISWSPDSKLLAFSSDRSGAPDLYTVDVKTKETKQLTKTPESEYSPVYSPDGNDLAYLIGFNGTELRLMPANGGGPRTLARDPNISGVTWSPDSKWLAYARTKAHSAGVISEVFVMNPADSKAVNVTRYPMVNSAPEWAGDGKSLFLSSDRSGTRNIWRIPLVDEPEKDPKEDAPAAPLAAKAGEKKPVEVKIDFEDIHKRARQVTRGETDVFGYAVAPDGKSVILSMSNLGRPDLWRVPVEGGIPARLTQTGESSSQLQFTSDGAKLYYLSTGGVIKSLAPSAAAPTPAVTAINATMSIDARATSLQMFDEAWRKMRDGFYDEKMHGVDWARIRETYRPVVEDITYKEDFSALFNLVLGELNASHTGIAGATGGERGLTTASFGVELEDSFAGPGVKVKTVMRKGPADTEPRRLLPGDIILSVEGEKVGVNESIYPILGDKAGKWVELSVRCGDSEKNFRLKPISLPAYRDLAYELWQREREQLTDKLSGGRLGYLHLSSMNAENLEKFKRAVFGDMQARDGMVIDVRFNGGGSIADELFAILQSRVFSYRTLRGDPTRLTAPLQAWVKPTTLLINELSFSNAEVFPWGYRELGLGKVVGVQTFGAVIGTSGTTLIDGSALRMPAAGSYTLKGVNMENNGCPPDIHVEQTLEDIHVGRDRQLERAIQELVKDLR